jgi:hypothetical protein
LGLAILLCMYNVYRQVPRGRFWLDCRRYEPLKGERSQNVYNLPDGIKYKSNAVKVVRCDVL